MEGGSGLWPLPIVLSRALLNELPHPALKPTPRDESLGNAGDWDGRLGSLSLHSDEVEPRTGEQKESKIPRCSKPAKDWRVEAPGRLSLSIPHVGVSPHEEERQWLSPCLRTMLGFVTALRGCIAADELRSDLDVSLGFEDPGPWAIARRKPLHPRQLL